MANADIIVRNLSYHQAAAATAGTCQAWDKALFAYLRTSALQHADLEFGANAKASDAAWLKRQELESRYGKCWRANPEAAAEYQEAFDANQAADDQWSKDYCEPHWKAGRALAATPAPTMAAALFKAALIETEELWNDRDFKADAMQVLHADFARLTGEAA